MADPEKLWDCDLASANVASGNLLLTEVWIYTAQFYMQKEKKV